MDGVRKRRLWDVEWEYAGTWLAGERVEDHLQEMLFPLQSLQRKLSMPKILHEDFCLPFSPKNPPKCTKGHNGNYQRKKEHMEFWDL